MPALSEQSDWPHTRRYCASQFERWQRVNVDGLCAECGERKPLPNQTLCHPCGGYVEPADLSRSRSGSHTREREQFAETGSREPVLFAPTPWNLIAESDADKLEWLIEDLLPLPGTSILGGAPKAGKSTLARALGAMVAGGGPGEFAGRACMDGKTLYFSLEGAPAILRDHLDALKPDPERFAVVTQAQTMPATPTERIQALEQAITEYKPSFVVLDPLQKFVGCADLNDYTAVSDTFAPYDRLAAQTRCHVMFVHHVSKQRQGERRTHGAELVGSTALAGAVDCALILRRGDGEQRTIYSTNRNGRDLPLTVLSEPQGGFIHAEGTKAHVERKDTARRIVELVDSADKPPDADAIRKILGIRKASVSDALSDLVDTGKIERFKDGRKWLYRSPFKPVQSERFPVPYMGTGTGTVQKADASEGRNHD